MKNLFFFSILFASTMASAKSSYAESAFWTCVGQLDGNTAEVSVVPSTNYGTELVLDWDQRVTLLNPITINTFDLRSNSLIFGRANGAGKVMIQLSIDVKTKIGSFFLRGVGGESDFIAELTCEQKLNQ